MAAPRVTVVSGDPVGALVAGPAIRSVELARVVADAGHGVVLAAPGVADPRVPGVGFVNVAGRADLEAVVRDSDVVVAFAPVVAAEPWIAEAGVKLVVDAYDPGLFETLVRHAGEAPNAQRDWVAAATAQLLGPLRVADVVLVANRVQRQLVVGLLTALGRVGPRVVAEDPDLGALVREVPFGLPDEPPLRDGPSPLRQVAGDDAFVAFWGGGLYPWLDPLTLVEAVGHLARQGDVAVSAVFLAGPHPTPAVGRMELVDEVERVARRRGLLGRRVHLVERWVPYAERGRWLSGADVGVTLHGRHLETEFAFRTRVLDYLWAGLPILCSSGDSWSEDVARADLGAVVEPGDVEAVAEALVVLAREGAEARASRRSRLAAVAAANRWSRVARPLVDACAEPWLAPDRRVARNGLVGARDRLGGRARRLVASRFARPEGTQ